MAPPPHARCPECGRAVDVFDHDGVDIFEHHLTGTGTGSTVVVACPGSGWIVEDEDRFRTSRPAPAHGTLNRYMSAKWRCRCELCREAGSAARARPVRPPRPLPPHGTYARYVSRRTACRCPECIGANRRYHLDYRATKNPQPPQETAMHRTQTTGTEAGAA